MSAEHDEQRLRADRFRMLAEHANDVLWTMSLDGRITYVSAAVEAVRGFTPEEAMAQPLDEIQTPASQAITLGYFTALQEAISAGEVPGRFQGELEYYCKDGSTVWTEVQVIPVLDDAGAVVEILGVTRDISGRKAQEEALRAANAELARLSSTDHLTGAANRRAAEQAIAAALAGVRDDRPASLVLLDVDLLKTVNDVHGHEMGDRLLAEVAAGCTRSLPEGALVARWGGDEFVLVLPGLSAAQAAQTAAEAAAWAAGIELPAGTRASLSGGAAQAVAGDTEDSWVRRADRALYGAKQAGRARIAVAD